ncbi:primosomal protein N' [Hydrogenovibrio sp. 3SP14C1]|uniref:primosomal protein N' n=1 Tax=Hydrogenovibrio sp. 3SP14C1 TaxID=3038774 RepID=UPI002415E107|nr:primosomal protein N' [Hydrogenovibrio sp. 3SP14C1]MDG4811414.1 primosomal protein N' [Hydrogenovibrio sp. 3SP14C1]
MFVKVAVPGPFLSPLDYRIHTEETDRPLATLALDLEPEEQTASKESFLPVVGGRVKVPFRNKSVIGIVMALSDEVEVASEKLKALETVIDETPIFSEQEMALLQWASHYYHEPIGNVVQTALPKRLKEGEMVEVDGVPAWQLTEAGQDAANKISSRATQQKALWHVLQEQDEAVTAENLNRSLSQWRLPMKRFQEQGWVNETEKSCLHAMPVREKTARPGHILNAEQQMAVDAVLATSGFEAFLLEGVTGSGKTEVYLGMIESVIAQGKQVLVLVPEIGLTPQTVKRFEAYLQAPVAVMHSGLNDKERHCAWSLVKTHQVTVLLGTRSAIFTPFANLGLCIMDEEHDLSFKQQDGFRYSARDCLVRRAQLENVPVVLGSATPSLEALHNALSGRYQHLHLKQRAGDAKMPEVQLLDVRGQVEEEGVSQPLKQQVQSHLEAGGQVLLFLNRRGFAPVLMCHDCGWQAACPSCDANMTFHQQVNELRCHHCGYQAKAPHDCPSCGSVSFVKIGQGTERLEAVVREWFPAYKVLRVDRDTTRNKGQMMALTEQASQGQADILIGTQMLAKGHHFPKVTLVGLLDIDQGLFSCDFRAAERMAQLVVQVSGRAGRGERSGQVVIQTHHPEHPLLKVLVQQGYEAFAKEALKERDQADLPPFQYQVLLRAEAVDANAGWTFLNDVKSALNFAKMSMLRSYLSVSEPDDVKAEALQGLEVFGPVSAPMLRRQGRYRYQLLIQGVHRGFLHQWLAQVETHLYTSNQAKKVRWSLDVDPQEMS